MATDNVCPKCKFSTWDPYGFYCRNWRCGHQDEEAQALRDQAEAVRRQSAEDAKAAKAKANQAAHDAWLAAHAEEKEACHQGPAVVLQPTPEGDASRQEQAALQRGLSSRTQRNL